MSATINHIEPNRQGFAKGPSVFTERLSQAPVNGYWQQTMAVTPLVTFRIFFGLMMLASILRFWYKGWINELYIQPSFFFSYYGFEWVKPLGVYTYGLFALCAISALLVALGLFYRVAALAMFLSFTYIELMDKTTYLNHYYFVSLVSLLLVFLPANASFSLDAWRTKKRYNHVPRFTIDVLRVMMGILYVYAGIAKLNSDWLLQAQPLKTWLPAKNDLPWLGPFFNMAWVAYLFSWFGCLYDLTIPFWLSWRKTRVWAFGAVVVFHVLTAILFPIGMFPYIMIVSALIFFPASFHTKVVNFLGSMVRGKRQVTLPPQTLRYSPVVMPFVKMGLMVFIGVQLLFPFRYLLYPGELFWTEEGYRFSWRVMLMEKTGYTLFTIKEPSTGNRVVVENHQYLTPLQEKQMSFQPDMILEFAHHLAKDYRGRGWPNPEVYAESYVTLNGRASRLFIDSTIDLAKQKETFRHKKWVTKFEDEIQGF